MNFFHVLNTLNNIRKGKYARFMKMYIQHFKSCRKIKAPKISPHTKWDQNMVMSAFDKRGNGGLSASAVCLACK